MCAIVLFLWGEITLKVCVCTGAETPAHMLRMVKCSRGGGGVTGEGLEKSLEIFHHGPPTVVDGKQQNDTCEKVCGGACVNHAHRKM